MSGVKFPAEHLSAFDIGHRVTVTTLEGARITDKLTGISVRPETIHYSSANGKRGAFPRARLYVNFESVGRDPNSGPGFELALDSWVKRHEE